MLTLKALADRFGLDFRGDADTVISGIGTLADAQPGQLAFLANSKYTGQLADTRASVVILGQSDADACPCACLISQNPYTSFALITALFDDGDDLPAGIHATAVIADTARIGVDVRIGPYAVIGPECVIGDRSQIHAHVNIGRACTLDTDCLLLPKVTLVKRVHLGKRVRIHSGQNRPARRRTHRR
jgi:UDP-3-O-[3-hydroxymyristoyl] glucosamine N-acyltransferase